MLTVLQIRSRLVLLMAVVVAAAAVVSGDVARAGEYTVKYCQPGLPLQDWQRYLDAPGSHTEGCASGTAGVFVAMDPNTSAGNTRVAWTLRWPDGIRPVRLRANLNRVLNAGGGASEGGIQPYGWCSTSEPSGACPSGQTTSVAIDQAVSESVGAPGQMFTIGVRCPGLAIAPCEGSSGSVDVSRLEVVWSDTTPPTGTATIDALTRPADGGPAKGPQQVEYRAADDGSGVRRVEARIDGRAVVASPDQCREPFVAMRPCSSGAIGQLTIDTANLDDGSHQLDIVAIDVGANETLLRSGRILTQNGTKVGPGSDPGLRGGPNGGYGSDDARLIAWWPSTARKASRNRAVRRHCKRSKRYRRTHTVACSGKPALRALRVGYSARKANTFRGRLLTPGGDGIAGATLQVVGTPTATGAASSIAASVVTDGTGRFSGTLPVALGSATYSVQWRARVRDTVPAASINLQRSVRAATSMAVRPGKVVYRGQRLEISGKLRGRSGTPEGTAVAIQANPGRGWRAVTTVRARPSGRWVAKYRVARQLRGVYRWRAVIKPSAAYPYATGTSRKARVTIR